jgi:hypothetical protein
MSARQSLISVLDEAGLVGFKVRVPSPKDGPTAGGVVTEKENSLPLSKSMYRSFKSFSHGYKGQRTHNDGHR